MITTIKYAIGYDDFGNAPHLLCPIDAAALEEYNWQRADRASSSGHRSQNDGAPGTENLRATEAALEGDPRRMGSAPARRPWTRPRRLCIAQSHVLWSTRRGILLRS